MNLDSCWATARSKLRGAAVIFHTRESKGHLSKPCGVSSHLRGRCESRSLRRAGDRGRGWGARPGGRGERKQVHLRPAPCTPAAPSEDSLL